MLAQLCLPRKLMGIMNPGQVRAQKMVWWILWAAFQTGIFVIYIFLW